MTLPESRGIQKQGEFSKGKETGAPRGMAHVVPSVAMAFRRFKPPQGTIAAAVALSWTTSVFSAELPEHQRVDVLVLSDRVNPHGLSPEELTEPGDISAALNRSDSPLQLVGEAREVMSNCADEAMSWLESETASVLVYFAHQPATYCAGASAQADLVAAVDRHLEEGGGVVVFHHGIYESPGGKDAILELFGASAQGISYEAESGQRVFATDTAHFITQNGVDYDGEDELDQGVGFEAGNYPFFDIVPDEIYPSIELLDHPEATRQVLFATNTGPRSRAIGYTLTRASWQGRVVAYQPGENQPQALDDLEGNGFQILLNAILWSSGQASMTPDTSGTGGGGADLGGGGTSAGAGGGSFGQPSGGSTPSGSGSSDSAGDAAGGWASGGEPGQSPPQQGVGGSGPVAAGGSFPSSSGGDNPLGAGDGGAGDGGARDNEPRSGGCQTRRCSASLSHRSEASWLWVMLLAVGLRTRRRWLAP